MTIAAEKQPCLTQVLLSSRRCYTFFSIKTQKLKKIIITRQALRSAETKEPSRQQHCVLGSNRHAGGGENAQLAEQCGGRTSAGTLCESTGAQNVGVLHRPGAAGPAAPPLLGEVGPGVEPRVLAAAPRIWVDIAGIGNEPSN